MLTIDKIFRMKTEPLTVMSKALCAGLLVLAGIAFQHDFAVAQPREACTRPAGVSSVAPPDVTAQQVETGSASLREFALAVRDRFRAGAETPEETFYIACLLREEGSPWRSGSTYLVTLTPDGRIYEHAKSMALAGRLLERGRYGAILQALGIDPADLADPAAAQAAFTAARAGDGGPFDVPGVPGASGYAIVSAFPGISAPFVLLAGFDLDATHLAAEQIDYGDPAVTAAEVVDRETLKAFVTQAGNYFVDIAETGTLASVARTKVAFRDPNGPWRHGSVYLYALDLSSNIILFHGAFPDRFENRPLQATVTDAVTGRLILPQVLEAAASHPEGGFVEYHFDDPNDPNDSADIPKTGFAREFTARVGPQATIKFVVGSGFYGRAPDAAGTITDKDQMLQAWLARFGRTAAGHVVDAVQARLGAPPEAGDRVMLAGHAVGGEASAEAWAACDDWHAARRDLRGTGEAEDGEDNAAGGSGTDGPEERCRSRSRTLAGADLLTGSSFSFTSGDAERGFRTVWGSGAVTSFDGSAGGLSLDGEVTSVIAGVDRVRGKATLGLAAAHSRGDGAYGGGEVEATLTGIHPYAGYAAGDRLSLWGIAGIGKGTLTLRPEGGSAVEAGIDMTMAAAGVRGVLAEAPADGGLELALKADGRALRASSDAARDEGGGVLAATDADVSRFRLGLEGTWRSVAANGGGTLTPTFELGLRHDGGDAETGFGVEAGAGLAWSDPSSRLSVEFKARTLLVHAESGYRERGVSGAVRISPDARGRGLSLSLASGAGAEGGGVDVVWSARNAAALATGAGDGTGPRVAAEIGYGLPFGNGRHTGTPYAGLSATEAETDLRLGWRLRPVGDEPFRLSLEASRREDGDGSAHGVGLRIGTRW